MRIRELDPRSASDEELLRLHALQEACAPPGEPFRAPALSLGYYRHAQAKARRRRWVAEEGDAAVATAGLFVLPGLAQAELEVLPSHRRRGIGSNLLELMCAAAREEGVTSFFGHHFDAAGAAFAAQAGARDDQRDVRARLDLRSAQLPDPVVPAGWRLMTWIGAAPEELVHSFAKARDAMRDAPMPGEMATAPTTVEDVRSIERTAALRGREVRVTVALDERGEIGAFTDLRATPGAQAATTDDTAVAAWARSRGLGRAVKAESLRRLCADHPEVETVSTLNAEHNGAMRHINASLGFVPTLTLTTSVLTL